MAERGAEIPGEAVAREVRAMCAATLRAAPTPRDVVHVGREAMAIAEAAFAKLCADDAGVARAVANLHCKKYCAHCCYKSVGATPDEVFTLAAYIEESAGLRARTRLVRRLRELDRKTRGLSPGERGAANLACALLVGRLCMAHPARPAACRGFNSRDVTACQHSLRRRDVQIPVFLAQYRIFADAHLGLRAGLGDVGLRAGPFELTAALRIALEVPDAAGRWLAGEDVFPAATVL